MYEVRIRETGEVVFKANFEDQLRRNGVLISDTGLNGEALDYHGADIVMPGPQPTGEWWQSAVRDGVEEINGNWYEKWVLTPTEQPQGWLDQVKSNLLDQIAQKRWEVETGGITLPDGTKVDTDRESSQQKIKAAFDEAMKDENYVVNNWKVRKGVFVTLTNAQLRLIGQAVLAHIQACFDKEAALSAQILAAPDYATLMAIKINKGWPA